jgi:hypothetical protein
VTDQVSKEEPPWVIVEGDAPNEAMTGAVDPVVTGVEAERSIRS